MEPADFLTILGLVLAVWAIIPSKERRYLLLFFSNRELYSLGIGIVFIHYLMAFDWLRGNWLPFLSIVSFPEGVPANIWAYLVSLFLISYPVLKVSFGYYSSARGNNLLALYNTYLKENEIDLLVRLIDKYHAVDIVKYLEAKAGLPKEKQFFYQKKATDDRPFERLMSAKRIRFAAIVYGHIIQNKTFIRLAANKYPDVFAKAFAGMESPAVANKELIELFIECLFEAKNQAFVDELKLIEGSLSSIKRFEEEDNSLPILSSLLTHTKTAVENYVWRPVGEGAIRSLKNDSVQRQYLLRDYDSDIKPQLWDCKIYIATVYFNYMVRETIYRDSQWHMWLFYYQDFVRELITLIPRGVSYDPDSPYPLFAHYLINELFSIMDGWLNLAKNQNVDYRVIDTIRCTGRCIHLLCQAGSDVITIKLKQQQFDRLLHTYFEFAFHSSNIGATTTRKWLRKMFLFPNGVDLGIPYTTIEYRSALLDAWRSFDKVPYASYNDSLVQEFENDILMTLGL